MFLFLRIFVQKRGGTAPLKAGIAFLPLVVVITSAQTLTAVPSARTVAHRPVGAGEGDAQADDDEHVLGSAIERAAHDGGDDDARRSAGSGRSAAVGRM